MKFNVLRSSQLAKFNVTTGPLARPTDGVMRLVETARREISEARQEHDLGDTSGGMKEVLDTLSKVDSHLHRIHDTAERIVLQNARSKSGVPGS